MHRVSWQDYRQDVAIARRTVWHRDFPTIEAARAECDRLTAGGMTACVAPTPAPKAKPARKRRAHGF